MCYFKLHTFAILKRWDIYIYIYIYINKILIKEYIYIYIYIGCFLGFKSDHLLSFVIPFYFFNTCRWLFKPAKLWQILPPIVHCHLLWLTWIEWCATAGSTCFSIWVLRPASERQNSSHISQLTWWLCGPGAGPCSSLQTDHL